MRGFNIITLGLRERGNERERWTEQKIESERK